MARVTGGGSKTAEVNGGWSLAGIDRQRRLLARFMEGRYFSRFLSCGASRAV
jgi:hypothetical protein